MQSKIDNYKDLSDMLKRVEANGNYSEDVEHFAKDCTELINYINESDVNNNFTNLYVIRQKNNIQYGEYGEDGKKSKNIIKMTSNDDLKTIYNMIESKYKDRFMLKSRNNVLSGLSLSVIIPKNIIIEFDSDNKYDKDWFSSKTNKDIDASKIIK